ncbi:erythromycin esterase family protein [Naasia sp. SYSU D00948]|uniref:erythromycin esterase family protein n=1 Tax=Naasia sp. SYSU D00948 TaxID=2817379 RepID=UPI001B3109E9|nr:erythromycin esterase family protein [Naasia sp. SYSU D00948]
MTRAPDDQLLDEIRSLARPLTDAGSLDPLIGAVEGATIVAVGEASHGTSEFYSWRCTVSRRLLEEGGFSWIAVEGDWPDCWRLNRWVRGVDQEPGDARTLLQGYSPWPAWMWANEDVALFLDWLRRENSGRPPLRRIGFYGLDVYSLWDSLRQVRAWAETAAPAVLPAASRALQCLEPYGEDPHEYAWSTRVVPGSCEPQLLQLLREVRVHALERSADPEAFSALQNAEVAVSAERYYRAMVRGGSESWNLRDTAMAETVDRIADRLHPGSRGLVWAHNTHIGDARATDMAAEGMLNLGELLRRRRGDADVRLVGFACSSGTVTAASSWGEPAERMPVPPARRGSHEDLLHRALGEPALLLFPDRRDSLWLGSERGHRAIGVVYDARSEYGNYVPTRMGARYDALLWLEETHALTVIPTRAGGPEYETEPSGF